MAEVINYYSQHYRAVPRLIKNAVQNAIFQYLLDEHISLIKQGISSPAIKMSYSIIGENAGVNRNVVCENLKKLAGLGLVTIQNDLLYINVDYLEAVVTLFNSQPTNAEKLIVASAFRNNDFDKLKKLGLEIGSDGNNKLRGLKGSLQTFICTDHSNDAKMLASLLTSKHQCQHLSNDANILAGLPTSEQDCQHLSSSANILAPVLTSEQSCQYLSNDANILALVLRFRQQCQYISTLFPTKSDFIANLMAFMPTNEHKEDLKIVASVIYEPDVLTSEHSDLEFALRYANILAPISWQYCQYLSNRNKYIEINKEINVSDELRSSQYIGGKEENFEVDERTDEELSEISKQRRERKSQSKGFNKEVELRRKRESFNTFSEEEVDEIISDINNTMDAPEKIFIYFLWGCLRDYVFNNFIEVEDGEETPDINSIDITQYPVPASQMKRCLEEAYEETLRFIETKRLSPDDEELPVPDFEFSGEDVELVIGWKPKEDYKERGVFYHITKSQFHNLHEKLVEASAAPNKTSRRRRNGEVDPEIEDDYSYIQKINQIGETDEGLDKLTPIEEFVYWFCQEFLEVDDNLRPNDTRQPILWVKGEDKVKELLLNVGLTSSVFPKICAMDIPKNLPETPIRPRMFSAAKIRRENQAGHFISIIDDYGKEE